LILGITLNFHCCARLDALVFISSVEKS